MYHCLCISLCSCVSTVTMRRTCLGFSAGTRKKMRQVWIGANMQTCDWASWATDAWRSPAKINWTLRCMKNNWSFYAPQVLRWLDNICSNYLFYCLRNVSALLQCYLSSSVLNPMCNHFFSRYYTRKKIIFVFYLYLSVFNVSFFTGYFPFTCKHTNLTHTKLNLLDCDRQKF